MKTQNIMLPSVDKKTNTISYNKFVVGNPKANKNPIHFQVKYLEENHGLKTPEYILETLEELNKLSIKNKVDLTTLCQKTFKD